MLRLDREENGAKPLRQPFGGHRRRLDEERLHRPFERQAVLVHRRNVLRVRVAEQDRPAVTDEPGTDGAADCPGSHEHVVEAFGGCLIEACQR